MTIRPVDNQTCQYDIKLDRQSTLHLFRFFSMFVRSVGSDVKTGPVRSGLRSRIGLALISVRIALTMRKFRRRENFRKNNWALAIDFVKKSSKSELSSRFLNRLKILQDLEGHHETCEVPIWRSCEFLSVTMRFVSKNHPRCPKNQLSMIFGGVVKKSISIFFLTFGTKLICTFWFADMMI